MKFTIEINCDSAAFEPEPQIEVQKILSDIIDELTTVFFTGKTKLLIHDINGNTVGVARCHTDES